MLHPVIAKTYGTPSDPLALAIHGWADNANSFDPLIPKLPSCFYYVCIDLPGHGKSSPVETSLILRDTDYIIPLKLIYNHFNRDKITLIGHSLGGFLSLAFAQLYPKCVHKIIIFDVFYFYPEAPKVKFSGLRNYYNRRIRFLQKGSNQGPVFTKEGIINRLMTSRVSPMSRKAAEVLLDRGIEEVADGKYRISVAANVKQMIVSTIAVNDTVDIMQRFPIRCPHLFILSSNTSHVRFSFRKVHDVYKKNPDYEFHIVDGSHEFHIEIPEIIAPLVSKFLLKYQNKL